MEKSSGKGEKNGSVILESNITLELYDPGTQLAITCISVAKNINTKNKSNNSPRLQINNPRNDSAFGAKLKPLSKSNMYNSNICNNSASTRDAKSILA